MNREVAWETEAPGFDSRPCQCVKKVSKSKTLNPDPCCPEVLYQHLDRYQLGEADKELPPFSNSGFIIMYRAMVMANE